MHKLQPGEKAFIVDVQNPKLCEQFFEMGIFPGDMLEVRSTSEDSNSIVIYVNNNLVNVYRKIAETIITHTVSFQLCLN